MTNPDTFPVLSTFENYFQEDSLHNISRHWGEGDWPVIPQILPPFLLHNNRGISFLPVLGNFMSSSRPFKDN